MNPLIALTFLFLSYQSAWSYIPRTQTIIKKMTSNNGSREYKVVREVVIESADRQQKAQEIWTVSNGDKMRVSVSSLDATNPWQFVIQYNSKGRQTFNAGGRLKTLKKSRDFFEPLFHDRYYRSLTKRLIRHRFIPDWIPEAPAPAVVDSKTVMTPEPFVSLEPAEGIVSYSIGAKRSRSGDKSQTRLWVEQDSFLIKKGRLTSGAEFVNGPYQSYPGRLKLPSEQRINWNNKMARIRVLKVERTKTKKSDWKLTQESKGSIPSDPLIKEFYTRFR